MTVRVPKYRLHKGSGQALVQIRGERIYLGKYGSEESQEKYRRLIAEFLAGRDLSSSPAQPASCPDLTINELILAYYKYAQSYYVKDGRPTREVGNIRATMRRLRAMCGRTVAKDFGPRDFKLLRESLIHEGLSRTYIGDCMGRIKRMFRWAASEELLPVSTYQALQTVDGLRKGRTAARETAPVLPVDNAIVEATLPHLPTVVADMVRFQRATGCRPGEVCILRPCDVDTSGLVWAYRPESHKTEHHGRERVIFIGPQAQSVLRPYLLRAESAYCFSPTESERQRREQAHRQRKTPLSCGNRPGSNCKSKRKRTAGERYNKDSYRRAIHRACDRAFPPTGELAQREGETKKQWRSRLNPEQREQLKAWQAEHRWSPNQLRHAAATEIRRRYGLEAAQVTLGHASANVSQIYAERDMAKAEAIMRDVG